MRRQSKWFLSAPNTFSNSNTDVNAFLSVFLKKSYGTCTAESSLAGCWRRQERVSWQVVPLLLWPALQHLELLPQHCLGRWQHQRLPGTALQRRLQGVWGGKKVQVFPRLSQGNLQPVILCRELVSASLTYWTLSNSCHLPTDQRSLWKLRNHHQKYFQIIKQKSKQAFLGQNPQTVTQEDPRSVLWH